MVEEVLRTLNHFVWFLGQATMTSGTGNWSFLSAAVLLCLFGLLVWRYPYKRTNAVQRTLMAILPVLWIFIGLWGAYHFYHWNTDQPKNPNWMSDLAGPTIFIGAVDAVMLLVMAKGFRIYALFYSAVHLYFILMMSLLAIMAITGEWM